MGVDVNELREREYLFNKLADLNISLCANKKITEEEMEQRLDLLEGMQTRELRDKWNQVKRGD